VSWILLSDKRSEDLEISYENVKELIPVDTPTIGAWQKFGLLYGIGVIILLGVFAF